MNDLEFKKAFEVTSLNASNAFDDPKKIAEFMITWAKKFIPERLSSAYWFDISEKKNDKGFDIKLYEYTMPFKKKIAFHVGSLVGAWSGGLELSTMFYDLPQGITAGVGVGVVVPYDHIGRNNIKIVPSLILRF